MGTNVEMIVRPDGDRLMAKVSGQDYFQVFRRTGDSFSFKVVDAELTFTRSRIGAVSGFTLFQDAKTFYFDRVSPAERSVHEDAKKQIPAMRHVNVFVGFISVLAAA
jgi:hypothetical protein